MTLALGPPATGIRSWATVEGPVLGRTTAAAVGLTVALVYIRVSPVIEETRDLPSFMIPAAGVLALVALVARLVEGRHPMQVLGPATVLVSLFVSLFIAVRLPGLIYARDTEAVITGLTALAKDSFVAIALVFAAERTAGLRGALWGLVAAGALLGSLTVMKVVTGAVDNPYGGFSRATGALVSATETGVRYTGPFEDPNFYAQTLTVIIAVAAVWFWNARSLTMMLAMTATLVVCLISVGLTLSRGGMVATAVVIIASIVYRFGRWALVFVVFAAAVVTGVLPGQVVDRVVSVADAPAALVGSDAEDPSIRGRTSETLVGASMFLDNPVLGVGYGNYEDQYLSYSGEFGLDSRRVGRAAHNLFLEAGAELGLFGGLGFGAFVGAAVVVPGRVRRRRLHAGDRDGAAVAEALQLAVIGYLITAIFLHDAFTRSFMVLMTLAIGSVMLDRHDYGMMPPRQPRRLRVVQIVDSLTTGGAERLVAEFGGRASRLDIDLMVISLAPPIESPVSRDLRAAGVAVRHAPASGTHGLFDRARKQKLSDLLRDADPDLVHLHLETATIVGGSVAAKLRVPTIVTLHNTKPALGKASFIKGFWLRWRLRRVDRVVAVGHTVAKAWEKRLGSVPLDVILNPARTVVAAVDSDVDVAEVLDVGVDRSGGPIDRPSRRRADSRGANDDGALLIAVGRLTEQKGIPDLLDAMAIVVAAHPEARLQLVGDGPERIAIEERIEELGLERVVELLGIRHDVEALMAAADVFVMSSHWEGLPLALLEAMASGLAVVATQVGDVVEIVPEGAGLLVPPHKPEQFAAAIVDYLDDPAARVAAGEAARHHVAEHHHLDRWAERLHDLYLDVGMAPSPGSSRSHS